MSKSSFRTRIMSGEKRPSESSSSEPGKSGVVVLASLITSALENVKLVG